jgi:hypothetical protein
MSSGDFMLAGKQCAKMRLPQKASLAPFQFLTGSTAATVFKNVMLLVSSRHTGSQAWQQNPCTASEKVI